MNESSEPFQPTRSKDASSGAGQRMRQLKSARDNLPKLLNLWQSHAANSLPWRHDADLFAYIGERFLRLGALGSAQEAIAAGLDQFPKHVRLRQLQGLAWARSGAIAAAQEILENLQAQGHADAETLGILARTYKDQGCRAVGPERTRLLRRSRDIYTQAYAQNPESYWTGINAATLTLLLGDTSAARTQAAAVHVQCLKLANRPSAKSDDRYWPIATLGEAALIADDLLAAEQWYSQAVHKAAKDFGDIATTHRQAKLILQHYGHALDLADRCLPVPKVAVFVGHMIDRPDRKSPRFPMELAEPVRVAIRRELEAGGIKVGYASAASGADILFHEVLRDLGGESRVVLPYDAKQFAHDRMKVLNGDRWKKRFAAVLKNALQVVTVTPGGHEFGGVSYDYANRVLEGLAQVRAAELSSECVRLAVWDGQPSNRPGDVGAMVKRWQKLNPHLIRLDQLQPRPVVAPHRSAVAAPAPSDPAPRPTPQVLALLFADCKHFSELNDVQVQHFLPWHLRAIARLVRHYRSDVVAQETWGDGLYLAFRSVAAAGRFALDLRDRMSAVPWKDLQLHEPMMLRIGLHAGPVFRLRNPVTNLVNYTGIHVTRCARIEPITPLGQVYASQAFAALAAGDQVTDFTCQFVRLADWAKSYGTFPTYAVQRVTGNT